MNFRLVIIAITTPFIILSCTSLRKSMDAWMGQTKQTLILQKGPPDRTASDGGDGEVLIYSNQTYNPYTRQVLYSCAFYYANSRGVLYHWMIKTSPVPPQQMNVDLYVH